ncbi:hypothetical protein CathTA2_1278 [Caldalkalibacillus thermarum TA2.A1]|uniref:YkoP-like domain-containing protein n=1 Tax=Caldalkalibacillus thermarum (strain TA2.A1) TaxID=986075 RepID=F5L665_CALTT|nr:hypothetical protein [Caldalkalibacillus thermarum]EGL83165.1 hypothetical protein CathTA2_1278 [Caldalkalibacillus thermarum TA2.A1]QZT35092.1 hypothetical protein HUR95_07675 [Caldalkalibacillus thermarum TA2.A1]
MKSLILHVWAVWDWIYFLFNRMQYVSKQDNFFRIVRTTYKGPPIRTRDGHWIRAGDDIIKIHLYNFRIAKEIKSFPSEIAFIFYFKRSLEFSLYGLSRYVESLPDRHRIKGIMGTSMFNRGAERLGFTICEVDDTWYYRLKGLLYKLIYWLIHPQGWGYLKRHGKRLQSKHLVMSVEELHRLYPNKDGQLMFVTGLNPTGTKS